MASEIMQKVLAAEQACNVRLEQARQKAAETVQDAAARADSMRREAAALGKQKAAEILAAAEKEAAAAAKAEQEKSDAAVTRLRAEAAPKRHSAVEETVRRLMELS